MWNGGAHRAHQNLPGHGTVERGVELSAEFRIEFLRRPEDADDWRRAELAELRIQAAIEFARILRAVVPPMSKQKDVRRAFEHGKRGAFDEFSAVVKV